MSFGGMTGGGGRASLPFVATRAGFDHLGEQGRTL